MEKLPPGFLSLGSESAEFSFPDLLGTHRTPPQLPDEIIEEILLCIPPDDHEHLLYVALVCKRWACLLASRGFRRRYRERHRTPLLLGFLGNLIDTGGYARFIPTRAFRPVHPDRHDYRAHDARHGRVLLNRIARCGDVFQGVEAALIVWDPITDDQWPLPPLQRDQPVHNWTAAVLCATAGVGTCDHLDCLPGDFHVVFVGIDDKEMFASVYSSDSATWSEATSANLPHDHLNEAVLPALAGNALYFVFRMGMTMLKYDLATKVMSVLPIPISWYLRRVVPMAMDDGGLGLAEVDMQSNLILWSMEVSADGDVENWVVSRQIDLRTLLPAHALAFCVVAVADAVGVIFVYTDDGVYTFNLNSGQVTKVFSYGFYDVIPFVSFYTPVLRAALDR
ncbi:hypothetical protein BDA96_02G014000 [Sorghum bicolor]|uniref:F-box domain-containing protein n=1 Tax=Sorghum bicolor TaxID=4558 RepID=A0A921URA9_SORBI|nr:hypothetical protein BDA96_02G014000 [Sorghum bicolor]